MMKYESIEVVAKFCKIEIAEVKAYIKNGTFGISETSPNRVQMESVYNAMSLGIRANSSIIDKILNEKAKEEKLANAKAKGERLSNTIAKLRKVVKLGGYELRNHPALQRK